MLGELITIPNRCPHKNVAECPLYIWSHTPDMGGCIWGEWALGCAVDRGEMEYPATLLESEKPN